MKKERLKRLIINLISAINSANIDEELKMLSSLEKLLVELDAEVEPLDKKIDSLKHFVHHYEKIIEVQKFEEIKNLQEFIDKNG